MTEFWKEQAEELKSEVSLRRKDVSKKSPLQLMTPGPVPFAADLLPKEAVSHTDPTFRQTMRQVQDSLGKVFGTSGFTAALTGSGSWGGGGGDA